MFQHHRWQFQDLEIFDEWFWCHEGFIALSDPVGLLPWGGPWWLGSRCSPVPGFGVVLRVRNVVVLRGTVSVMAGMLCGAAGVFPFPRGLPREGVRDVGAAGPVAGGPTGDGAGGAGGVPAGGAAGPGA